MRRSGRIIFNILTAFSLLLCVVSLIVFASGADARLTIKNGGGSFAGGGPLGIWLTLRSEGIGLQWSNTDVVEGIVVPLWLVLTASAILPSVALSRRFTQKKPAPGLCPVCSYDLRATPDRCPECGADVRQASLK